ncbi:hypothetical protein RN001_003910 [Aquatica leii]|uniref:Large ribosomal subunit protein bL19m n=1 Tax=Aquatica leii TaxID=1421715 RepID=A0AAN7SMJ6_9COLE|nr:hypothetical protein RN001_003910 [Aquatica leii]
MLLSTFKIRNFFVFNTLKLMRNVSAQPNAASTETKKPDTLKSLSVSEYRNVYVEFLPDPTVEFRNPIREKLERFDMLARRENVDIPEFYVGSILAVTYSDPHSLGKTNRFVGICIKREGCGLRAKFLLRNVIDQQGVEVLYEMYDPSIIKVEVLRLEKRLDDELLYLRDSLPEYSTFDSNMEMEILPEGTPIPINTLKVKLKPKPWLERWERKNLRGVESIDVPDYVLEKAKKVATPWEKHDLMKQYMKTIPEEEQITIFNEIQPQLQQLELTRKKLKRKRSFIKPVKLG